MNNKSPSNLRATLTVAALLLAACSGKSGGGSGGAQGTGGAVTGRGGGSAGAQGTGGAGTGGRTGDTGGTTMARGGSGGSGGRASGGTTSTGGSNSGGVTSGSGTGGLALGGNTSAAGGGATSSTASGGAATGGRATGGMATGGVASGGQVSTGGQAGSPIDGGASSGCGMPAAVTGAKTGQTITVAGRARTYVLSVPTGYTGTTPLALVFAWHGANISGSLARSLFNLESKSNGAAIFVYPDGLPMNDGGMTGWDLSTGSADFQFFENLLTYIISSYCIDSNRIFATGHSMGAMMTNILGCSYGDVLRAIAPASGTPPGGGRATCTGKVGAWIAHGENDPTVPFSSGEASRDFWIKQNGCSTETKPWAPEPACVEYQGCQTDLPVVWCVHDEGHSWPSLTFGCDRDAGGTCFDGGSAIWAFFSSFH